MNWQDKGYLININKYNENSSVAEFFTNNHGKTTGIIFGSSSKKIKNYLFNGNEFHINFSSKNENSSGNFKIEIENVNTPLYLNYKLEFYCILYTIKLIRSLSVENQKNINVYKSLDYFFESLIKNFSIKDYIFWELQLLKDFGFELNYSDFAEKIKKNGSYIYVSKSADKKKIPNFLLEKNINNISKEDLLFGFNLTGEFIYKSILDENNSSIFRSRNELLDLFINL